MNSYESTATTTDDRKPENILWVEEVLLHHLDHEAEAEEVNSSSVQPSGSNNSQRKDEAVKVKEKAQATTDISIAEIEFKDEGFLGDERIQFLSRIVVGKIKYRVLGGSKKSEQEVERYSHWFIKLPNLVSPQRQLSQMIDAARREISFYTEILPAIKSWLERNPPTHPIEFRVPTCFYGKFNRPIDKDPDFDVITHILESESLLVLDDLRAAGYGKRHFSSGLLLSEAMAAIDEIVKFHVTTWAMQVIDKRRLNWPQLYDWQQLARLYSALLEKCFPSLKNFLTESNHPQALLVLGRLQKIKPQLLKKFLSLLKPPDEPLPLTLLHMDLWSENILFRTNPQDKEDEIPLQDADLDCCILDWQMVSYGSPTHDLALLLMLSLDPQDRIGQASILLKYYYESFKKTANYFNLEIPFNLHMLANEFRQSCTLATFMAMASIDVVLMEESTQKRLLEALVDLMEENFI